MQRQPFSLMLTPICLLCCVLAAAARSTAAAPANLLRNPSFEAAADAKAERPARWEIGTIYGTGPNVHEWSQQARTGERSLRLHSMHVTEYVQQRLPVQEGGRFALSVHARGAGRFMIVISAVVPGEDGDSARKQLLVRKFGTTDRWLPYSVSCDVPASAEELWVMLGTPRHNCNVWFDDAGLTRLGSDVEETERTAQTQAAPARLEAKLFDVTPFCGVRSDPFALAGIRAVTDSDPLTRLAPEIGPGRGARIAFDMPREVSLTSVELVQSGASSYLWDADTDGDGGFDRVLARVEDDAVQDGWVKHRFEPVAVHAVRLVGLVRSGRWPQWDRSAFPSCAEVRIQVAHEPWMDSLKTARQPFVPGARTHLVPANVVPGPLGRAESTAATPFSEQTGRGVCICPWMLGWHAKSPETYSKERCEAFAAELERLRLNHVVLMLEGSGHLVPWPSSAAKGADVDFLDQMTACLGEKGIRTFFLPGHGTKSMRPDGQPWPTWFGRLLSESMAHGCSGVSVCADEFPQCGGSPDPSVYAQALKRDLGLDEKPPVRADTEAYRRFMLFHYRQVGAFHRQAAETALAQNPAAVLLSNWRIDPVALNSTYGCLAYDVLAEQTGLHLMGTDPYFSDPWRRTFMERCVKLLAAANRPRGAMAVLKAGQWGRWDRLSQWRSILTGGSAVAAVMHGAEAVTFYRHNYLRLNANTHWVREAFEIVEHLDQQGFPASRGPRDVAILHSRASEDFWQHRCHMTDAGDPGRDGVRGYVTQKVIEELLLERSIPTAYFYLDREDTFESELSDYGVVLLPFPYCISDRAARAVAAAREAGAHVIVCDRLGEANELGTLRAEPVFASWREQGTGRFAFVDDVLGTYWRDDVRDRFVDDLIRRVGEHRTLSMETGGRNLEGIVRHGAGDRAFVAFINWEDVPLRADVSLNLPAGDYTVQVLDKFGRRPGGVTEDSGAGGDSRDDAFLWGAPGRSDASVRTHVTAADLAHFTLSMPRQFVRVLIISPKRDIDDAPG